MQTGHRNEEKDKVRRAIDYRDTNINDIKVDEFIPIIH